jgi:hypothetical protein
VGLSLTLVADGTTIDATAVQSYIEQIEYYVNEGIDVADLDSAPWVDSVHIFKPEFYGAPRPRVKAVSGETQFFRKNDSMYTAFASHYNLSRGGVVHIPGLQATLKIPEDDVRVKVLASFAAFEWGGSDVVDEAAQVVAKFYLYQNETQLAHTARRIYPSGSTPGGVDADSLLGALVARKQVCIADYLEFDKGIHSVGVRVDINPPTVTGAYVDWKHVFVLQRSFVTDYNLR